MHNYEAEHGRLPPAVVYGSNGKALYSWRVLVLPYLEQEELFEQFHRDEPWDSPHNLALLERMPPAYSLPPRKSSLAPPGHTFIHVFVGKGTAFENPQGEKLKDFPDGVCNTILLLEGGEAVPWTKPEDIRFDPELPLPKLATVFNDIIRVATADGHTEHLKKETAESTWRAMITRNGGEQVKWE
jgi:Protein of unknown function (DUF1559)